jgi:hypothetical protein
MQAVRSWTASTRNQRLACIRSFFTYAAAAEPALAIYLADLAAPSATRTRDLLLRRHFPNVA